MPTFRFYYYFFLDCSNRRLRLGDNRRMARLRDRGWQELTCVTPKTMQQLPHWALVNPLSASGRHAFNFTADRWQQLQFGDIKFWHWIITAKGVDDTPNSPLRQFGPLPSAASHTLLLIHKIAYIAINMAYNKFSSLIRQSLHVKFS